MLLQILSLVIGVVFATSIIIVRIKLSNRPTNAKKILLPPLFMSTGFFMFRKFLKSIPKSDGKSILDWQTDYINRTRHLWTPEQLHFLDELVQPVPPLFRDVAKQKIAGKIGEAAIKVKAKEMSESLIIEGYIKATPKRDHKILRKTLLKHQVDITPYEHYFET